MQQIEIITGFLGGLFIILACLILALCCSGQNESQKEKELAKKRITSHKPSPIRTAEKKTPIYTPPPSRLERRHQRDLPFPTRPIPGVSHSISKVKSRPSTGPAEVKVLRGGEFVGNRMRFKVKVLNNTPYVITDVTIFLLSYPKEALRFDGDDDDCHFSKIEPGGFRSPTFDFLPTQDCVRGEIVAGVSYLDIKARPHTLSTKPFVIRAVCDLLIPDQISPEDFASKLELHEHGEIVIKVDEWTPEEMFDKAIRIIDDSNFFEVNSDVEVKEGIVFGKISGLAKGKYTGKSVGVQINISGPTGKRGATCTIKVSGEDQAMILPAIDDLKERLSAWLCPLCGSQLTLANVEDLKDGKVIECPFCAVSIGR
jgi:hypothetical protein